MPIAQELPDPEVIDLEPTEHLTVGEEIPTRVASPPRVGAMPAMLEGTLASMAGETNTLRRSRLAATAFLLALIYLVLLVWNLSSGAREITAIWVLMGARLCLAAAVAGLLMGRFTLSAKMVRAAEFVLFGGLTIMLAISQYVVIIALVGRGDIAGTIAFLKNGVSQMIVLMLLYGTFIPNSPRTVAKVVSAMVLTVLFGYAILTERSQVDHVLNQLRSVEQAGSNVLFLLIGAGIAVFGAATLNGLRNELHKALKFGQYRLVRKLGEGGMGEVYLAEHQLLKRPCALKLIKSASSADPLALARFEREVQSAARLAHPNTIEIFDYGRTDDGTFYYVMEYLQGMSLTELLNAHGPLPAGRVVYLMRQVCAGLAEAHALGLVHRDLKPANVFIAVRGGESDVAKVLDFGLVKLTQDPDAVNLSTDMTVSGTPLYMSPEQARGDRSLDTRSDVYALGAVMYCALTGRPPFEGDSPFEVMISHSRDPVTPPSQVRPGVPTDLEQIALRCLAKKPADRYPTVKAVGEALAACAAAREWGPNRAEAWWMSIEAAKAEQSETGEVALPSPAPAA
jgi:serine/threonine-protein kinase